MTENTDSGQTSKVHFTDPMASMCFLYTVQEINKNFHTIEKKVKSGETISIKALEGLRNSSEMEYLKLNAPKDYKTLVEFLDMFKNMVFKNLDIAPSVNTGGDKPVKISPKKVSKAVQTIDKISNTLFDPDKNSIFYDSEAVDVIVGKKKGKDITTAVSIDFSKLDGIQFSNDYMLDPYAQAVHNAMLSMYLAGNKGGSIAQLYRVLYGNKDTLHPDEVSLKEIKRAVEKLRHTDVTITIKDEAKYLNYKFENLKIKRYVMPVDLVSTEINGERSEGFVFLTEPPLYEYARQKNQVNTLDIHNFNIPLNAGKDTAVLLDYLNERLAGIKNKKSKMSDVILYDTLYSRLQLDAPTEATLRAKKRDVRKKVKAILDSWIKEEIISGYEEELEKPSNRIRSLKILP